MMWLLIVGLLVACSQIPTATMMDTPTGVEKVGLDQPLTDTPTTVSIGSSKPDQAIPAGTATPPARREATPTEVLIPALELNPPALAFDPYKLVMDVGWSADGDYLAVSAGNSILFYDATTLRLIHEESLLAYSPSIAFSPDGALFAAGSRDGFVRIWQVAELLAGDPGKAERESLLIEAHERGVNCVAFDPSGSRLASGGNDAIVRIWEANNGNLIGELIGGTYAVPGIAFSPDGSLLAILNGDFIRLRETESTLIWGSLYSDTHFYSVAYHPSGDWLAAGDIASNIYIWDPGEAFRSGVEDYPQPTRISDGQPGDDRFRSLVWEVLFHPDGSILAGAGGDGLIRLWDIQSAGLIRCSDEPGFQP